MKKIKLVLLCSLLTLVFASGCGKNNEVKAKVELSSKELMAYMLNYAPISDELIYSDEIEVDVLDGYSAKSNGSVADEYLITRADDVGTAVEELEIYKQSKLSNFEGYAPKEADKIKKSKIVKVGNYVALFISDKSEELCDYFEKSIEEGVELSEADIKLMEQFEVTVFSDVTEATEADTENTESVNTESVSTEVVNAESTEAEPESESEENKIVPKKKKADDGQVLVEEIKGYIDVYDSSKIVEAYKKNDVSLLSDEKEKAVLELSKKVISENITDDMTAYEKEKAMHDYIIGHTDYDKNALHYKGWFSEYADQPYGCLIDKRAICLGYATTFKMFMDMLDVECVLVPGSAFEEKENHAWNLVKLEDGQWYVDDLTWSDIPGGKEGEVHYFYFNVTDELTKDTHHWESDKYPAAVGGKYESVRFDLEDFGN